MKKILCTFAVSTAIAMSGQAFADIQYHQNRDVTNPVVKSHGDIGLPGIYLWNVTHQEDLITQANPLTCGLFIMQKGDAVAAGTITGAEPLTLDFTYGYNESKVILAGKMTVSRCESGETWPADCSTWGDPVTLKQGDLVGFDNGDRILFSTDGYAQAYYCGTNIP